MIVAYKNSTIYYTDTGKGKAIVLLHGFLESSVMWRDFIPELSKNNRVICIDLLGHGQTDCIGYIHTMEAMAEAVFTVLKHLNIESASFMGHSMGGYVALALANMQPHLFSGLCLMNSTFEADTEERKLLRARAVKMAQHNYENLVRMSFANLFAPKSKTRFKAPYENALKTALNTPVQGYIAAQKGMSLRLNHFETFKNINAKKVIIIGKKDTLITPEKIKTLIKNTTIIYRELSEGHMSHIENKTELSYIIKLFI